MPCPPCFSFTRLRLLLAVCGTACNVSHSDPANDSEGKGDAADHAGANQDGGGRAGDGGAQAPSGSYVVGTTRIEIAAAGGRTLPVQLWYPAVEGARSAADEGRPIQDFEPAGPKHDALDELVTAAPDKCTNKTMHAADGPKALALADKWPLIVFSHCMDCTRFSMFTVAEHLTSLGFVVAAPDHVGGTVYERKGVLDSDFLKVREADIKSVLDALLDDSSDAVPEDLRGQLDSERVGAMGHSYGSVTTGLVLQNDARVKAGVLIAAPPDNPLLAGASIAKILKPALYFEAMEDHSIQLVGNSLLENNYSSHPNPAWLVKVADAGHWSFSDICALTDTFKPGCGMDTRQNPVQGGSFTYLDNDTARGIAKHYIAAFFVRELLGDLTQDAYLGKATPAGIVMVEHHD